MRNVNADIIKALSARGQKQTEFNGGLLTADRYVKTVQDCVGSDLCYRYAAKGNVSFDDAIKRASKLLTYNNDEMAIEQQFSDMKNIKDADGNGIELPKNTLMVFKHVLTTTRKDRDGDVLRTQGARIDPKMLLLWQHIHTLPIGKMLHIWDHTTQKLTVVSAIVDMNDLAHDAAVMVDNKMGRFSHGFNAFEYSDLKEDSSNGDPTAPNGFDIKLFEILEESLVSVPSNVDADTEEIMLSMVEGKQFKSELMKSYGKSIRESRPDSVNIPFEVKVTVNQKADTDENDDYNDYNDHDKKAKGCTCGPSKETDANATKTEPTESEKVDKGHAGDESETSMDCPKCDGKLDDSGTCQQCGYIQESGKSTKSMTKFYLNCYLEGSYEYVEHHLRKQIKGHLMASGVEFPEYSHVYTCLVGTFADYAIVSMETRGEEQYYRCDWSMDGTKPKFTGTAQSVELELTESVADKRAEIEAKHYERGYKATDAMSLFLAKSNDDEKQRMLSILKGFTDIQNQTKLTESMRPLLGR